MTHQPVKGRSDGRITAADVARAVGVSRATVGYVLNDTPGSRISAATRQRVLNAAARLGYQPSTVAQALARGGSRIVLIMLPDWPLEFTLRAHLEEAARTLEAAGYAAITSTIHDSDHVKPIWRLVEPEVVVGLLPFSPAQVASIRAAGITRMIPDPDRSIDISRMPAVIAGAQLQVRHLVSLKRDKLSFAGPADQRMANLAAIRQQAVAREAAELGAELMESNTVDFRDKELGALLHRWLAAGISGVVAFNDDIAAMLIGAAVRTGISVPANLAVVGHDDTPLASYFVPTISSAGIDTVGFGRWTAEQALRLAQGKPLTTDLPQVNTYLIQRESTGTPGKGLA